MHKHASAPCEHAGHEAPPWPRPSSWPTSRSSRSQHGRLVSPAPAILAHRGGRPSALASSRRPTPAWDPRADSRHRWLGLRTRVSRVLDQPDYPVLVTVPTVDNTRHVLLDVVEQV